MSLERSRDSSSSSDEEVSNSRGIQVPNVNFSNYLKNQQKGSSKTNLTKAGKRLKRKSVRFPDLYRPRDTIISTSSATNNSSDSDIEGEGQGSGGGDPSLPSFSFKAGELDKNVQVEEDEDMDGDDGSGSDVSRQEYDVPADFHASDDSDDDIDDSQSKNSKTSKGSRGSRGLGRSKGSKNSLGSKQSLVSRHSDFSKKLNGEIDITDQCNKATPSSTSSNVSAEEKKGGFRSILRRLTLSEPHDDAQRMGSIAGGTPSASDTFMGHVVSLGNGTGGMVPGASRHTKEPIGDEEQQVGESGDWNSIEMKKLDFAHLSDEAQKLIASHVPEAANLLGQTHSDSDHPDEEDPKGSPGDLTNDNTKTSTEGSSQDRKSQDKKGFYVRNPEFFLRGDVDTHQGDADDNVLDEGVGDGYVAPPKKVQAGVLSSLLKLYQNPHEDKSSLSLQSGVTSEPRTLAEDMGLDETTLYSSKPSSTLDFEKIKNGPKKMVSKFTRKAMHHNHKQASTPSNQSDEEYDADFNEKVGHNDELHGLPSFHNARPKMPKKAIDAAAAPSRLHKKIKERKKLQEQQLRITVHITDILQRQKFIMMMCRALMMYGAPTHRLEEYMVMTSRVLEIDGQFVYFPGVMITSFGDVTTRTSEVHLVRCVQGLNLSKLSDTHRIYKAVIHDLMGVEEAAAELEALFKRKNLNSPLTCVLLYGLGASMVCPFAFNGGWYDIPIAFGVGLCVGYLQFFVSSMSNLYSSVFEVASSIVVSFIARAIGSIHHGKIFCFSAIAQGSLALILPGYIILCGSLELQSRNLVAGSVRMFYAIIYSLFLGFGITLGAALFGWVYKGATSERSCENIRIDDKFRIIFVPAYSIILGLINQARLRQLPIMTIISCTGYVGTYFAGKNFKNVPEFTAAIGAFIVGILGNLYSRIWKGMAVSAMLPAIFVQVPSGIASQSTLLSGLESADEINKANNSDSSSTTTLSDTLSFGATMVEVSIGISVGLFAAALVVYPFGKRKTGLFTL